MNQKLKDSGWSWCNVAMRNVACSNVAMLQRLNVDYFTEEDHVKKYAKATYGWLDISDTTYGDNVSSDDNSVSDIPDSTTPNILSKQQTAILPDDAMSSIVTMVETNISQSSQHQKHPKKC